MIQFNLLPDVKKDYVKAKRTKRLIMTVSFLVSAGSLGILLLLFSVVQIAQKKHISDLGIDIKAATSKIQSTENLESMLSVQNQLILLPNLHEGKPETSRLFDYVSFVSPQEIKVSSLDFNFKNKKITIQGTSDSLASVDKFVGNIKATTYSKNDETSSQPTYFDVTTQLSGDNEKASFKIQLSFDPAIFDNTIDIIMKLQDQVFSTKPPEVPNAQ